MRQNTSFATSPEMMTAVSWLFVAFLIAASIEATIPSGLRRDVQPPTEFSSTRALAELPQISQVPHPIGSDANERVRDYLLKRLSDLHMAPRILTGIGTQMAGNSLTVGRVENVVGKLSGTAPTGVILLCAHYDSVMNGPGAADDGSSVAAILETVRALGQRAPPRNDIEVLFTDGEEEGSLGAQAFLAASNADRSIKIVLNFEARGDAGPSLLFETGRDNMRLVDIAITSHALPIGSSIFYSLYKMLPNRTDFTLFREQPGVTGLNFAYGGAFQDYHTKLDSVSNVDADSLAEQGSYAFMLADALAHADLRVTAGGSDDAVYFDIWGRHMVSYPQRLVGVAQTLLTAVLLTLIVFLIKRRLINIARLARGVLATAIFLLVTVGVAIAFWLFIETLLRKRLLFGDANANDALLIGLTAFLFGFSGLLHRALSNWLSSYERIVGGLAFLCSLNWIVTCLVPGGSYLLFWPLLFAITGVSISTIRKSQSPPLLIWSGMVAAAAAILLWAPLIYFLYLFLTLQPTLVAALAFFIGSLFSLSPAIARLLFPTGAMLRLTNGCLAIVGGGALIIGMYLSHPSAQNPQRDSLIYSLDANTHTAVWLSVDTFLDPWTGQFMTRRIFSPKPEFLGGSKNRVWWSPAPSIPLQPPSIEIQNIGQLGNRPHRPKSNGSELRADPALHDFFLSLNSQRKASMMRLRFPSDVRLEELQIQGMVIPISPTNDGLAITLFGFSGQSILVNFKVKDRDGLSAWLMDETSGLPPPADTRPSNTVAISGSDITLVSKKVTF